MDYNSSHVMDFVIPREGETFNDSNWAYYLGTLAPTSSLSFSNQFSWKGLTLSFMITGSLVIMSVRLLLTVFRPIVEIRQPILNA